MELAAAYRHCQAIAAAHYENFPVASRLLPAAMRAPVAVVYAYARGADDLADEGDASAAERLAALAAWGERLAAAARGRPDPEDAIFVALADLLASGSVPLTPFQHLLVAFRQDVTCKRYADYEQLLDYCRHSADPVGRILLHLHFRPCQDEQLLTLSDRICSSLQIINFLQDLTQDYQENNRIYLPQAELAQFGVSEEHFRQGIDDPAMRALWQFQIQRTRATMLAGAPLGRRLRGRFGLEIRAIVEGGLRVLERLEGQPPFTRPRLSRLDGWRILLRALRGRG